MPLSLRRQKILLERKLQELVDERKYVQDEVGNYRIKEILKEFDDGYWKDNSDFETDYI
jgi:hypothetical protein